MATPVLSATGIPAATAAARYGQIADGTTGTGSNSTGTDFSALLGNALQGVVQAGHQADAQSGQALLGQGNLTDVVNAVSQADLALQTTTAIRDRVVQAYQDIIKMAI
jgi:flagellar hook-basal body complex protein FliE